MPSWALLCSSWQLAKLLLLPGAGFSSGLSSTGQDWVGNCLILGEIMKSTSCHTKRSHSLSSLHILVSTCHALFISLCPNSGREGWCYLSASSKTSNAPWETGKNQPIKPGTELLAGNSRVWRSGAGERKAVTVQLLPEQGSRGTQWKLKCKFSSRI